MVCHENLISLLASKFSIGGNVLQWLQSYLSGRNYKVKIDNSLSESVSCEVSIPQSNVLGPILFNCIMAPLLQILKFVGVGYHSYAHDTQILGSFSEDKDSINNEAVARMRITRAFSAISFFMQDNHLKLNPIKTQFIPFSRNS